MKQPLRVSVTMLDTFIQGMANQDISSEMLAQQLFSRKNPTPSMQVGTAFHRLLEQCILPQDTATVNDQAAAPVLHHSLRYLTDSQYQFILPDHLNGIIELGDLREQKYEWPIFDDLILVGKIDAETHGGLIDHKLTCQFDHERYMDSMQWRAYLAMRGKFRFTYQIFEHSGLPLPNHNSKQSLNLPLPIVIKQYHRLDQYAYAGMLDEVRDVAQDLARFARDWLPVIRPAAGKCRSGTID